MYKNFFVLPVLCTILSGCDLQPRISSIPDSIGAFISDRYPALLADPETQPEIYNSAVTDYGVYASPELYGAWTNDDYVMYASVDDYVLVPADEESVVKTADIRVIPKEPEDDYLVVPTYARADDVVVTQKDTEKQSDDYITVAKGDTLYSIAKKNNTTVDDLAKINSLTAPYALSVGQKLQVRASTPVPNVISKETVQQIETEKPKEIAKATDVKRVDLQEITVQKGDTLYSLSRKYQIPVNDLAVMNKLNTPFSLSVGQKLKVPKLDAVQTRSVAEVKETKTVAKKITPSTNVKQSTPAQVTKVATKVETKTETKVRISSDPKKQLPKISARSSSKFSWPVKGKVISQYGAKNKGLFNDGINIVAAKGTPVKSAENGVVAYAGNEVKGMGNLVIVQHSDGWMTVYAHMDSLVVRRGTKVTVGQQIGRVGQTGRIDSPQLHFEIRKGTKAYNPQELLKK